MGLAAFLWLYRKSEQRADAELEMWRRVRHHFGWEAVGGEPLKDRFKGLEGEYRRHELRLFVDRGSDVGNGPTILEYSGPAARPSRRVELGHHPTEDHLMGAVRDAMAHIDANMPPQS